MGGLGDTAPSPLDWYFLNSTTVDGWPELQLGGTPPATTTTSTGWTVTGVLSNYMSRMEYGVKRLPGTFGVTTQPSGIPDNSLKDAWRTASPSTGTISASDWTFQIPLIASTSGTEGASVRVRLRVWFGASADGSDAYETATFGNPAIGSTVTVLQSETQQISIVTITGVPELTLSNEYVFIQAACEVI